VHIWSSGTPIEPHRPVSAFTKDELVAEIAAAGVDGAVIHPPSWDPTSNAVATGSKAAPSNSIAMAWLALVSGSFASAIRTNHSRSLLIGMKSRPGVP
jgi:hypothetical protein